jgi:hypothetical protein
MPSPGRTPLSEHEKAKRLAARKYRKLIEVRNMTEDDLLGMRVGDKNMGRKPVPIPKQIKRAKKEFLSALNNYRDESQKIHVDMSDIKAVLRELKVYRSDEKTGRKAADKVIQLKDFLRKETAKLEEAKEEECALKNWSGKGRPPMSKEEKIEHFAKKVADIQNEINELIANAPLHKQLYYSLNDIRLEVRRKKALLKEDLSDEAENQVKADLLALEAQRDALEEEFNQELKAAGISNVKDIDEETESEVATELSKVAEYLSKVTKTLPNSAKSSIEDIEALLSEHLNNKDELVQILRDRLAENQKEQSDLAILTSILLRRYELKAEQEKLDNMIQAFEKD